MKRLLGTTALCFLLFTISIETHADSACHQRCLNAIANFEQSKNSDLNEELKKLKRKMTKKALKIAEDANQEKEDIKLNDDFAVTKFEFNPSSIYQTGANFQLHFQMEGTSRSGAPILINLSGGYDLGIVRGAVDRQAGVETGKVNCQFSHIMPYYVVSNLDNGHIISEQRHRRFSRLNDILNVTLSNDLRKDGMHFSATID